MSTSTAGTEICSKGVNGCLSWVQGLDCESGFSCDTSSNDGTCKAGCTNDQGCDAGNEGTSRCVPSGTAEQTCEKVGACYVFKKTREDIPQECTGTSYCSAGKRFSCVASAAGTCTQHVAEANACPANTACQGAGQCVSTCVNKCTENLSICTGNTVQTCKKGSNGCTSYVTTDNCTATGETCLQLSSPAIAVCKPPACVNKCTENLSICTGNAVQTCKKGSNGCTSYVTTDNCTATGKTCVTLASPPIAVCH